MRSLILKIAFPICVLGVPFLDCDRSSAAALALGLGIVGMAFEVGDYALRVTRSLPNGATNVTSTAIDLGHTSDGLNLTEHEFLVEAPALSTAQLPDGQTMTYAVLTSASADMSSPTVVNAAALVQTGAGGSGAAAATQNVRLPTDCQRYVGVRATKSGAGDASAANAVLSMRF